MRVKRLMVLSGISMLGMVGASVPLSALAESQSQLGAVADGRPAGASGGESLSLKEERRQQEAQDLDLDPQQQQTLAPDAIVVHTELLAAREELNGIRSQMKSLPSGAAPDTTAVQDFSLYIKNLNEDLRIAATHEAELKGTAAGVPHVASNPYFVRMDSSITKAVSANSAWQTKAKAATYWQNREQVSSDLDHLIKQIDDALDENQTFGSDQLDVSFVG